MVVFVKTSLKKSPVTCKLTKGALARPKGNKVVCLMGYISSEQLAKIKQKIKENPLEYRLEKKEKKNQQRLERISKTLPSEDEFYN